MRRLRFLVTGAGLCLAACIVSGCGSGASTNGAKGNAPAPTIKVPSPILGLTVTEEDISSRLRQEGDQPYIDSVGLFAFRQGKNLLNATIEVARFTPQAQTGSAQFRGSIISRIGGQNPLQVRVQDQQVFLTSGRNQVVFIWFKHQGLFVLTVRHDYPFPRTLLRRIIGLNIKV